MIRPICSSKKSGWRNERGVAAGPHHRPPSAHHSARKDRACIAHHRPRSARLRGCLPCVSGTSPWQGCSVATSRMTACRTMTCSQGERMVAGLRGLRGCPRPYPGVIPPLGKGTKTGGDRPTPPRTTPHTRQHRFSRSPCHTPSPCHPHRCTRQSIRYTAFRGITHAVTHTLSLPLPTRESKDGHQQQIRTGPTPMHATFNTIVALTDAFCRAHPDEEYAQLARQSTAAFYSKRPAPLATGHPKTWAC